MATGCCYDYKHTYLSSALDFQSSLWSDAYGIPKLPLPTYCPCELQSMMDLYMKDDTLF